ncbi:MAG: hypothetical protein LUC93_12695, partial [Planctomycetaceae bacterium]|nr:hypothetical protein [Planctomycetaceae bacterium]
MAICPEIDSIPSWYKPIFEKCFPYDPELLDFDGGLKLKTEYVRRNMRSIFRYLDVSKSEGVSKEERQWNNLSGRIFLNMPQNFNDPFDYFGYLN